MINPFLNSKERVAESLVARVTLSIVTRSASGDRHPRRVSLLEHFLFVFTQFRTQNRYALLLELL
jgi:hypothetical protein